MGLARKQRKAFYSKYGKAPLEQLAKPAWGLCVHWNWPLSDWEKQFEAEALKFYRGQPLFHGGVPGLSVGERLLPGTVTGNNRWGYAEGIGGTVYRVTLEGRSGWTSWTCGRWCSFWAARR